MLKASWKNYTKAAGASLLFLNDPVQLAKVASLSLELVFYIYKSGCFIFCPQSLGTFPVNHSLGTAVTLSWVTVLPGRHP